MTHAEEPVYWPHQAESQRDIWCIFAVWALNAITFDIIKAAALHWGCEHRTWFWDEYFVKCFFISFIILLTLMYSKTHCSYDLHLFSRQKMHCLSLHIRENSFFLFLMKFFEDVFKFFCLMWDWVWRRRQQLSCQQQSVTLASIALICWVSFCCSVRPLMSEHVKSITAARSERWYLIDFAQCTSCKNVWVTSVTENWKSKATVSAFLKCHFQAFLIMLIHNLFLKEFKQTWTFFFFSKRGVSFAVLMSWYSAAWIFAVRALFFWQSWITWECWLSLICCSDDSSVNALTLAIRLVSWVIFWMTLLNGRLK